MQRESQDLGIEHYNSEPRAAGKGIGDRSSSTCRFNLMARSEASNPTAPSADPAQIPHILRPQLSRSQTVDRSSLFTTNEESSSEGSLSPDYFNNDPYSKSVDFSNLPGGLKKSMTLKNRPYQNLRTIAPTAPEPRSGFSSLKQQHHNYSVGDKLDTIIQQPDFSVIECAICFQQYNDDDRSKTPRSLECGHTFCTDCLEKLLRWNCPNYQIDCATCHTHTSVEGGKVMNLPKNYALMEVSRALADVSSVLSRGNSRGNSPTPSRKISSISRTEETDRLKCPEHEDLLRSYCTKDGKLICSTCQLSGSHKNHKTLFVKEAAMENRKKLRELDPDVQAKKKRMQGALTKVEEIRKEVIERGGELEVETDAKFDEVIRLIDERRRMLKLEIMKRTQMRVQVLLEQANDLHECIEKAGAVHEKTEKLLESDDDYSLLEEAKLTLELIEGVFTNPPPTNPRALNDLKCHFSANPYDEIASHLAGYGSVRPDVGTIDSSRLNVEPFHNGFRISWDKQDYEDNQAITYHLQKASGDEGEYSNIFRGSATKFTWKADLERGTTYRFRIQVRTTEGVGNWSEPKEAVQASPAFHWHDQWRSVKIDLSKDKLVASLLSGTNHWATFAGSKFFEGRGKYYIEIEILDIGRHKGRKKLAIGVIGCSKGKASSLPWQDGKNPIGRWDVKSWAFFPVSGLIMNSKTLPEEGISYGTDLHIQNGDRIGMLVDMDEKKLIYFCNGNELGVAFDNLNSSSLLPAVSIRDKMKVGLRFPPPPYTKRSIPVIKLTSRGVM